MERRKFIQKSSLGITAPFWLSACDYGKAQSYPISVRSDHKIGHLLRESQNWKIKKNSAIETVIVGGGIAGLSAAYALKGKDYQVLELADRFGGTSGANRTAILNFAQGAHYDLEYPDYYGVEVLEMLERLGIISYQSWKKMWAFKLRHH